MNEPIAAENAVSIVPTVSPDGHHSELICRIPAPQAAGIVWLPAMGVTARKYTAFAAALADRGVATALLDWRGFGASDRRAARGSDWGYAELLADISAAQQSLARQFPDVHWYIGGHSLGGQLAALALAADPGAWRGYVIAGSGQPWWRTFPLVQRPLLWGAYLAARTLAAICGYFPGERVGFAGREARGVIRDWAKSGQTGRYRPARVGVDFDAALARVERPVLALRFEHDPLVPAASLTHLLNMLPRAAVTREDVAGHEFERGRAGHFDWMKDPQPVARRVAEWVARQV
jgi:predicted alpha/beta hydrolase